ncbi:MAG: dihydroorotase [Phycisphaerales bacterium]|nr:dihydroorotase [Phycisphaerales bacterium]
MSTLLIRGGRVIDPASSTDATLDLAIRDDRIEAIGKGLSSAGVDRVIDATGKLVVPGLIDPHVHLREPGHEHKETIASGTQAAVVGGFTSVCCMPNTAPALDAPELIRFVYDAAARTGACRVFPVAAATKGRKGEELAEIELLAQAGAVAISDDGDCIPTAGVMARVFGAVARTGLVFMQHCQDPTLTRGASMHAGEISVRLGLTGWPREAEEIIIERDVRLARASGCRYHVQHISSAGSVEIVRKARAAGARITAEASPHHLILTHEACEHYNTSAKVNPPLREASDRDAIRAGVADGTITVLATDHAPHADFEKSLPFEEAPMGLLGLESALPLYAEALVHTGLIGWPRLIAMMTLEPARLCGLDAKGLGVLRAGGVADVTILDPDAAWILDAGALKSRSRNTPFAGRSLRGRAAVTIVAGVVKHTL